MSGQDGLYKCVVRVKEIEDGTVLLDEIEEEVDRFFEHGFAQVVIEAFKTLAVDAVVLFETAEIEPIAAELCDEAEDAIVVEHPASLGQENFRFVKVARGGVIEQFLVRHGGPEEITEAAGERVVGEGANAVGRR